MRAAERFRSMHSPWGNAVIVLFLLAQAADGALTYLGIHTMGVSVEANPLLLSLMLSIGAVPALLGAKTLAACLGISLHLLGVHRLLAALTAFYFGGAVLPWMHVLLT